MWIPYNPNPFGSRTGDCVIRALTKVLDMDWGEVYAALSIQGYIFGDWGNKNHIWGAYLRNQGFSRGFIPDTCPACYTVADFCEEHPQGVFVLAAASHVVAVEDGNYFDSWDSGGEVPIYYWRRD